MVTPDLLDGISGNWPKKSPPNKAHEQRLEQQLGRH